MLVYKVVYVFFVYSWGITDITMTSHERHAVSNHGPCGCLLNSLCESTSKSALLPFVRVINWWPVNSQHKGPVTQKKASMWWRQTNDGISSTFRGTCVRVKIYFAYVKWEILCRRFTLILIMGYTCMSYNDFILIHNVADDLNLPLLHHVTMTHWPFYHRVIWFYNFEI